MAKTPIVAAKSGKATVKFDNTDVLAIADRILDGAPSRFIGASRGILSPIQSNAERRWLKRSGNSARAFFMSQRVTPDRLSVSINNDVTDRGFQYAFAVKHSIRTRASLDAEAAAFAGGGQTRGGGDEDRIKVQRHLRWRLKRAPTSEEMNTEWRRRLTRNHGLGAPSASLAGRNLWGLYVRTPARKGEALLIRTVRDDLTKLAKG